MKFKHSLNLEGSREIRDKFSADLEVIGYKRNDSRSNDSHWLVVNSSGSSNRLENGRYEDMNNPAEREFVFNINYLSEYDTALGIAAMVDDDVPHVGEWVKTIQNSVLGVKGTLHLIDVAGKEKNYSTVGYKGSPGLATALNLGYEVKATAKEIINHFKNKHMSNVTDTFTGSYIATGVTPIKKILGYKAPFDLFEGKAKAGSFFRQCTVNPSNYTTDGFINSLPKEIVEKWEPVYEEEEIILLGIGSCGRKVTVKKGSVLFHGRKDEKIDIMNIAKLQTVALNVADIIRNSTGLAGYGVMIKSETRFLLVGCVEENNLFSIEDLTEVLKAYEKVNG